MIKPILPLLLLFFSFTAATAQNAKPNYALLWEISGNDFQQKSYLFGTMHLRDERVFELCDSVLLCIEACQAFSMEVHPDSMLSYSLDREMQLDTTDQIGMMLDSFMHKNTIPDYDRLYDSLKQKQPEFVKNLLSGVKENIATKKRPQILDLTLFGYAKDREKNLHGMERIQDYRDMAQAFFNQNQSNITITLDDLVGMYRKGDINAIYSTFDKALTDKNLRAEMFTNRNVRMVDAIRKQGAQESTFFAMGAGHLPGQEGVIALLQQQGYTLRKVKATFTGKSDSLLDANKPRDLDILFTDDIAGYSIKVPSKPFFKPMTMMAEGGHVISGRTNTVLDLRRNIEYAVFTMDYPAPLIFRDKREVLEMLDGEYQTIFGPRIGEPNDVNVGGYPGKQMKYRSGADIINMQLMMRGNRLYAFTASHRMVNLGLDAQYFFATVKVLPPVFAPLKTITIPETGSQVGFPGKFHRDADTTYYQYPERFHYSYSAIDSLSTTLYTATEQIWSKYFTLTDSFLTDFKKRLVTDSFTVMRDTFFRSIPAYLVTTNDVASQYFADHLVFFTDAGLCELIVSKPEAGHEYRSWAFFNSFKTPNQWTGKRRSAEYQQRLLTDWFSTDSLTAAEARFAMSRTNMMKEMVPAVLKILKDPMPEDTILWESKHQVLWGSIEGVKDEQILPFVETYFLANTKRPDRQEYALTALLSQRSAAATALFFRLAPQVDTFGLTGDFNLLYLRDYLDSAFVTANLPAIMSLREHHSYKHLIVSVLDDLARNASGIRPLLSPYSAELIKDGLEIVQNHQLLQSKEIPSGFSWRYTLHNCIDLLGYFPATRDAVNFLKQMTSLPDAPLCGTATNSLFRLGEKANEKALERWHKNPVQWYEVLSSLSEDAYLDKIPAKWLDAETYIEGCIPSLLYDYDFEKVQEFKILEKRKHTHEGEKLWLYVFTFRPAYDGEPGDLHLGICGQPEKGRIKLWPPIIRCDYDAFDGKNKEAVVQALLKEE